MKKMLYGFLLWFIALFGVLTMSSETFAATWWDAAWWSGNLTSWSAFGIANANDNKEGDSLLTAATKFINFMLWLLASIALVICLYAGFKMVTSAGDEGKYKEGIEMMKKAGIGLVVIGLAWMIVKVVMWIITNLTA